MLLVFTYGATPVTDSLLAAEAPPEVREESKAFAETNRLEAFSDGVFAIAITLLVLEIKVPSTEEALAVGGVYHALATRWPSYVGYVISFGTLGIMWANHHSIFRYIRRTDRTFLLINVFFLMCIAFLPFPTALLAEYLPHAEGRTEATVFYGGMLTLIAAAYNLVWWYGVRGGRLLGPDVDRRGVATISSRYRLGPIGYLAATGLALLSVTASLGLHAALALLFAKGER